MNNKMVEMTLTQILEIDKKGIELQNRISETSEAREKELKKVFRTMEFDLMRAARKEAKKKYKVIQDETEKKKNELIKDKEIEIKTLEAIMSEHSQRIVYELFEEILGL